MVNVTSASSIELLATAGELAAAPLPPDPTEVIRGEDEAAYWVRIEGLADTVGADRDLSWRFAMLASGEADGNGWRPEEGRGGPFAQSDLDAFADLDHLGLVVYRGLGLTGDGDAVATVLAERARS